MRSFEINDTTPLRTWTTPAGRRAFSLAPHVLAIYEELYAETGAQPAVEEARARWAAYVEGPTMPNALVEAIAGYEAEQRENGYEGPPVLQEVSLDE